MYLYLAQGAWRLHGIRYTASLFCFFHLLPFTFHLLPITCYLLPPICYLSPVFCSAPTIDLYYKIL